MLTKEEPIPINDSDKLEPFIPSDIYADFYFYSLEPLIPPDIYADFYFYTLEPLTPPDIYADFYFYSEMLEKPPVEPEIYCPKQKKSYPESKYPGDAVCRYEACPGVYFDTLIEAKAYKAIHCPEIEVGCTIDAECPEGYECKDGICVKKTTLGKMSMWQIGMGAGAILGALMLFGQKIRKKEKK